MTHVSTALPAGISDENCRGDQRAIQYQCHIQIRLDHNITHDYEKQPEMRVLAYSSPLNWILLITHCY